MAYARTLTGHHHDAEDIVHDCYGRLLRQRHRYDLPRDGTKLLYKAITNACINRSQRRRPEVSLESEAVAHHPGDWISNVTDQPDQQAMGKELEVAIGNALAKLPLTQRAVVELRSLGHSLVDIAEILDITHANARVLYHRAKQSLAGQLEPFMQENVR